MSSNSIPHLSPLVVGGVGGSGTRVIAEILMQAGVFMGSDLNRENDNLWFTLLFKRPQWQRRSTPAQRRKAMRIFHKAMLGQLRPRPDELLYLLGAAREIWKVERVTESNREWVSGRLRCLLRSRRTRSQTTQATQATQATRRWGWKEPNSHIYLQDFVGYFGPFRYVHVIRHGLDMAFSDNQQQLQNWHHLFGIDAPGASKSLPQASLDYWIAANERAVEIGGRLLGENFLLFDFDALCADPGPQIARLLHFAQIPASGGQLAHLAELVRAPRSIGRYQEQPALALNERQRRALNRLGFSIEAGGP